MEPAAAGSPSFWSTWFQIVVLDLVLAGDNALVIALAVRNLTPRQQWLGRLWGTLGAVGLRLVFIFIVTYALRIPLLQAAGGLMLLWIAVKLLNQESGSDGGQSHHVRHGTSLFDAIRIIVIADVVMSLDNVLAVAGAAHGNLLVVILGIGISIPIVIGGSSIISLLLARFPLLIDLGAGILGWVGGRMILDDPWIERALGAEPSGMQHVLLQGGLALGVVAAGRWLNGRMRRASGTEGAT
jgi:YjbE family integral membrane protein